MNSFWRHGLHGSFVLGATCAGLVGVIYLELTRPNLGPPLKFAANAPSAEKPSRSARAFITSPMTEYSEVVERPLFSPSRRALLPAGEDNGNATNLMLIGTVVSSTSRHALIRHKQGSRVERVVEGQDIDGWTVESIQGDRVVLRQADTRLSLKANIRANKP